MVPGGWVYDTASFKKLTEELKQKETDSKKEDLVAEPVFKSTFPRNNKRRQVMVTTETKLNESKEEQTPNDT
jgi:16S rRNA G527 N7-methylase RsmG